MINTPNLEIEELKNFANVKVSKSLASATFGFSQCQLDILLGTLPLVRKNELHYSFPIRNIAMLAGRSWRPDELKMYSQNDTSSILPVENNNDSNEASDKQESLNLLNIRYRNGVLYADINEKAVPLFLDSDSKCVSLDLRAALHLSTKYAKRMYLLLSCFRYSRKKLFDINDLRGILDMTDGNGKILYEKFSDFRNTIEDSCRRISETTDLEASVSWRRQSHSIRFAEFSVNAKRGPKADAKAV